MAIAQRKLVQPYWR